MCQVLTKEHVARLLSTSELGVESLWEEGALQRTEPGDGVDGVEFHSSPYDLLEYMLWAGKLDVVLSKEQAALWVTNFAEIMEIGLGLGLTLEETKNALLEYSIEDELCSATDESSEVAWCIVESHEIMMTFCSAHEALCELLSYVRQGAEINLGKTEAIKSIVNVCRTIPDKFWT